MDSVSQVDRPESSKPPSVCPCQAASFIPNQNNVLVLPLVENGKLLWVHSNQIPQDLSGVRTLDEAFEVFPYPTRRETAELACRCSLHTDQVRVWFMAQRLRYGISWDCEDIRQVREKLFPGEKKEEEEGEEEEEEEIEFKGDKGESVGEVPLETSAEKGGRRGKRKRKAGGKKKRSSSKTRDGRMEGENMKGMARKEEDGGAGTGGREAKMLKAAEEGNKLPETKMKEKKAKKAKDPYGENLKTPERNHKAVRSQTSQSASAEKRRSPKSEAIMSPRSGQTGHRADKALLPGDGAQSSVNTDRTALAAATSLPNIPEPDPKPGSELRTGAALSPAVAASDRPPRTTRRPLKTRDTKHKTKAQLQMLRRSFLGNPFPDRLDYDQLEVQIALPRHILVQWFGDMRHYMKQKKPRWLILDEYNQVITKIKHRQRIKALAIAEASRVDGPHTWELKVERSEMLNKDNHQTCDCVVALVGFPDTN